MTADEYFAVSVEGDRTQLVEGVMIVNEPTLPHAFVQANLLRVLNNWASAAPGRGFAFAPTDVVVDEYNVYGPDVSWVPEPQVPDPVVGRLKGLPGIAVEVRSPSTWRYDVGKKRAAYERTGLPELWLVDTVARSVLVYRRVSKDSVAFDVELELSGPDELTSPLLPGFAVRVERLFTR